MGMAWQSSLCGTSGRSDGEFNSCSTVRKINTEQALKKDNGVHKVWRLNGQLAKKPRGPGGRKQK